MAYAFLNCGWNGNRRSEGAEGHGKRKDGDKGGLKHFEDEELDKLV
jgi:hypothetical protein